MLIIRCFRNPPGQRSIPARDLILNMTGKDPGPPVLSAFGKPSPAAGGFHFSKSDSGPLTLAVLSDGPCGIDLQECRPMKGRHMALARRCYRPEEVRFLSLLPAGEAEPAFYGLWARKEAFLKYRGLGLSGGPASFSLREEGPGAYLAVPDAGYGCGLVLDLPAPDGFRAALCLSPVHSPDPVFTDLSAYHF